MQPEAQHFKCRSTAYRNNHGATKAGDEAAKQAAQERILERVRTAGVVCGHHIKSSKHDLGDNCLRRGARSALCRGQMGVKHQGQRSDQLSTYPADQA